MSLARLLCVALLALVWAGCGSRDGEDWIGVWSGGDPDAAVDDDDATGDDDTGDDDTGEVDADGDGWPEGVDCDDHDADLNLDDVDNDEYTTCDGDCDDTDNDTYPGASEVCNGEVEDCDGTLPEDEVDSDGDGFFACEECDDTDQDVHPGADEGCDGIDTDCDGTIPADEIDDDIDGMSECEGDCDDNDVAMHDHDLDTDGASPCDGDCDDGDGTLNVADADGDGATTCDPTPDCDDGDATLNVDDLDTDGFDTCDGDCDDDDATLTPEDSDGDGASSCDGDCDDTDGALNVADVDGDGSTTCDFVPDCDDGDPDRSPLLTEACDGVDNDCDGTVPGEETDGDGDGYLGCADCNDGDPALNFDDVDGDGASTCDGDCDDNDTALNVADEDGDWVTTCDFVPDCDDHDPITYPGAVDGDSVPESCGYGVDNDCDGDIDEDCTCPVYVWADGTPGSPPGSWDYPYLALDAALFGLPAGCEQVHVREGTYTTPIDLSGRDLELVSLDGAADTILEVASTGPALRIESGNLVVEGFTIRGGMSSEGGGISLTAAEAEINGCVIESNTCDVAGNGGGIYADSSFVTLRETTVTGNDCYSGYGNAGANGGGLWAQSSELIIERCEFIDNYAGDGGGLYLYDCDAQISQTVIAGNGADDTEPLVLNERGGGGLMVVGGTVSLDNVLIHGNRTTGHGGGLLAHDTWGGFSLRNVTIADNEAEYGGGGLFAEQGGTVSLNSCIVAYNSVAGGVPEIDAVDPAYEPSLDYTDVWGLGDPFGAGLTDQSAINDNLSADPLFAGFSDNGDYTDDDLHLDVSSACIDAGDPLTAFNDPDGTRNDMGAYGGIGGDW